MSDQQQTVEAMTKQVESAKARIRLYKSGRTILEVYGPRASYQGSYVEDCKLVADWYACHADQIDAERYRWLRAQHHSESTLCVVTDPKKSVKLGMDCPSQERLDSIIDKAIAEQKRGSHDSA
jgi:hypothetical protein